jgi:hypothetical protein
VREDPEDDLDRHERDDQAERRRQVPAVGVSADLVRVSRTAVMMAMLVVPVMVALDVPPPTKGV